MAGRHVRARTTGDCAAPATAEMHDRFACCVADRLHGLSGAVSKRATQLEYGSTIAMTPLQAVRAREGCAPADQIAVLPAPITKTSSRLAVAERTSPRGPRRQRETLKALRRR